MKVVIDIDEEEYKAILHCAKNTPGYLTICERMIADGKPLDKIRAEIADIYCGQYCENPLTADAVREMALEIINKYEAESEVSDETCD